MPVVVGREAVRVHVTQEAERGREEAVAANGEPMYM